MIIAHDRGIKDLFADLDEYVDFYVDETLIRYGEFIYFLDDINTFDDILRFLI